MTKKIFGAVCSAALIVFFATLVFIMGVLYSYFSNIRINQLETQTALAAQGVEKVGVDYLDGLDLKEYRITWIDTDGTVKYDSEANSSQMENHLERKEVKEAMETGTGSSARYSTTLLERRLYSARKLSDGTVIRLSGTQYTWWMLVLGMSHQIIFVAVLAVAVSLLLASGLSKRIVKPLNELNLDDPKSNTVYEELYPLLDRIHYQQRQLKIQALELQRKKDEFEAATDHMSEGLVLLNEEGIILSINRSASMLLGVDRFCIGQDILKLSGSLKLQELLRKALGGEHTEMTVDLSGSDYQINASPVISNSKVTGTALLIFNITEKEKAEQMRREFTANVSHELKTPLQSILGCAELLSNGIVKGGDIQKFSQQILTESKRLIALVDDIIKLSRLDEGGSDMKKEAVDLYKLAEYTVHSLEGVAEKSGVQIRLTGEPAVMKGVPHLLDGIVYNLCDNAIKYNKAGGTVLVDVRSNSDSLVLTVKDTGIGIPEEQQERIFERFFRVDKSHSKEVGGTGLGLSIVKHAAKLHGARIELHSVLGQGTEVKVIFRK